MNEQWASKQHALLTRITILQISMQTHKIGLITAVVWSKNQWNNCSFRLHFVLRVCISVQKIKEKLVLFLFSRFLYCKSVIRKCRQFNSAVVAFNNIHNTKLMQKPLIWNVWSCRKIVYSFSSVIHLSFNRENRMEFWFVNLVHFLISTKFNELSLDYCSTFSFSFHVDFLCMQLTVSYEMFNEHHSISVTR